VPGKINIFAFMIENIMLIELTNQKAARLLHELEELHLIKV
jgi:hypothetical protein